MKLLQRVLAVPPAFYAAAFPGLAALLLFGWLAACKQDQASVTIYTSVDRSYSEPILRMFEARTGIRVDALYDVEAARTTGLVTRLVAEVSRPRADVFWNGELVQTQYLALQGVLTPYTPTTAVPTRTSPDQMWTSFGGRARVLIVNTDLVAMDDWPTGLSDFLSDRWSANQLAIAHPLFGTSATHAAALYATWGAQKAKRFYQDLHASGVHIVDGNSVVRDLVVRGDILFGLTDTDDACNARARGAPVAVLFPDQDEHATGTLVIPNTVAMIAGARHPKAAATLIDFLLSAEVTTELVRAGWFHIDGNRVLASESCDLPKTLRRIQVDPVALVQALEQAEFDLRQILVR